MKLRRLTAGVFPLLVAVAFLLPVSALEPVAEDGFESAVDSSEYQDLLKATPRIVTSINSCLRASYSDETTARITEADIDWNKAYKFYLDCNVFEESEPNPDALYDYFNQQYYIWQVPVSVDGISMRVDLMRGEPVDEGMENLFTEEELRQIESEVGTYIVSCVHLPDDGIPDYREQFNELVAGNSELENSTKIMVGGMGKMRSAFGLCVSDQGVEQVTLLGIPRLSDQPVTKTRAALPELKQNQSYSFEEMTRVMEAVPEPTNDGSAGAGGWNGTDSSAEIQLIPLLLFIACVAGVGFVIVAVWQRYKRRS